MYDVFVSYARSDRSSVERMLAALTQHLNLFHDESNIDYFERITERVQQGLAASRVMLVFYSRTYPTRRACQWELTAAYLTAQRQGDPSERILVVNPEPTPEHLQPVELRDAKFHPAAQTSADLTSLAGAVARHLSRISGSFGDLAPLSPPVWYPTQGLGSPRFVGRLPELWQIHSALHPTRAVLTGERARGAVAQVRGLGGVGKSLLAEEYALRFGAAYPGGVFWLRTRGSHDQTDLPGEELEARRHDELRQLAHQLGIPVEGRNPDELPGLLASRVAQGGQPCLWVVDDLPIGLDAHQVRRWIAPHPLAATLFTTRSQTYEALAATIDLDVLQNEDALALLTARRPPRDEREARAARGIVAALGAHALAVDVAGAALRSQQGIISHADFLGNLANPDRDELELVTELADALPNGHEVSIAHTLLHSYTRLGAEGQDFLRLAAVLDPAPIPVAFVTAVFARADGLDDQDARRQTGRAVSQAAAMSLASQTAVQDATSAWAVHALVARTVRFQERDSPRLTLLRNAAIPALADLLQATVDAGAPVAGLIPHARELARNASTVAEAELLGWVGRYDYTRGDFRSSKLALRQELQILQRLLGPDHPDTLTSMNNLAATLVSLGEGDVASDLLRQVIRARERILGADHPDTLGSVVNLAEALRSTGDLAGARDLNRSVLEAYKRTLGPDHLDTLRAMNNLAEILRSSGEFGRARELHWYAFHAYERILGPEHPDTLTSMNSLGLTFGALGDSARARDLHQQAFDTYLRLLGPEHPTTLITMNNLAGAYDDLGDPSSARDLQAQVLKSRRMTLGPDHPSTLKSMNNLAVTLHRLGDRQDAHRLHQEALDGRLRVLGPDHPDTLESLANFAIVLRDRGDWAGARDISQRALDGRLRVLGREHPDTLLSMSNVAIARRKLGDLDGARQLFQQVLDGRRRVLGPDHPDTIRSMRELGTILEELDSPAEADLRFQVFDSCRRLLGPDHPDTLSALNTYAIRLYQAGELTTARGLTEQVLDGRRRVLGPDHPDTLDSMHNLAATLDALGELTEALDLRQQHVRATQRLLGPDHRDTLSSMNDLGMILYKVGNLAEASRVFDAVLSVRRRILGPEHRDTLASINNLAITLFSRGDVSGAQDLFRSLLETYTRTLGPDHELTRATAENLARVAHGIDQEADRERVSQRRRWSRFGRRS